MKVTCVCNKDKDFFPCDNNSPLLEVGKEYETKGILVHSWYTEVWLEGFDVPFNSVCFREVNKIS